MKTKTKKILVNMFFIIIILSMLIWFGIEEYKEKKLNNENYKVQNVSTNVDETYEKVENEKQYEKEEVETNYKGYNVIAKLEIPKIDLQTYILEKFSNETLNISVVKFWGTNPNTAGNFCIAGHNFRNNNMFHDLKDLNDGDNFFIINNEIGKVEYEIYKIYKVLPEDVSCLSQETNGKKEVTLITCTNDSKERIIVKAREKE